MAAPRKKVFEVIVSKVPWTLATMELRSYFKQFGPVEKCILPMEKETGFHRGYAWIGFSSEEGQNKAIQQESHIIEGSQLIVQKFKKDFFMKRKHNVADES